MNILLIQEISDISYFKRKKIHIDKIIPLNLNVMIDLQKKKRKL